jgi:hypothetical protein
LRKHRGQAKEEYPASELHSNDKGYENMLGDAIDKIRLIFEKDLEEGG